MNEFMHILSAFYGFSFPETYLLIGPSMKSSLEASQQGTLQGPCAVNPLGAVVRRFETTLSTFKLDQI
ncbi:hypothetical protein P8452_02807 [Trifolium repens]|nr:hypothetical protein P8452_02807 [Trifolium repens]